MIPLSEKTKQLVEILISPDRVQQVLCDLEARVGSFTSDETPQTLERVRFAVLKVAEDNSSDFENAVRLASSNKRKLLAAAGFADDAVEHEKWAKTNHGV